VGDKVNLLIDCFLNFVEFPTGEINLLQII